MATPSIGQDYLVEREERIQIFRDAIDETTAFVNAHFPGSVTNSGELAAIVTNNSYFLLSNAYKRARLVDDNRTYAYKVAAMTAAAIMTVRPVRYVNIPQSDQDLVRFANWDCATRASLSYLGIALDKVDPDFIRRFHRANLGTLKLPCLSNYLQQFDQLIFMSGKRQGTTFAEVEGTIPFAGFNNIDLRGNQLLQVEKLINLYLMLVLAKNTINGTAQPSAAASIQ